MRVKYDSFKDINICVVEVGDIIHTHGNHEYEYRAKTDDDNKIKLTHVRKRGTSEWKAYLSGASNVSLENIYKVFEDPFKVGNYAIYINTNHIVRVERKLRNNNSLLKVKCSWLPNVGGDGYVVDIDKLMPIDWDFNLLKNGNLVKLKEDNNSYEIININFSNGTVQLKQIRQDTCASWGANNLIVTMDKIESTFENFKFVPVVIKVNNSSVKILKNSIINNLEIGDMIIRRGNEFWKYRVAAINNQVATVKLDQAINIKSKDIHDYKNPFHVYFEDIIEIHKVNPLFTRKFYYNEHILAGPIRGKSILDGMINIEYKEPTIPDYLQDCNQLYWPWQKIMPETFYMQEYLKGKTDGWKPVIVDYCNVMRPSPLKTNLDTKDFLNYLDGLIKELNTTKGELVDMRNFEKENMQAGKADAIAKRKEYERIESEKRYTVLMNQLDSVEAQIKSLEAQRKAIQEEMAKFE